MSGIARGITYAENELQFVQIQDDTKELTDLLQSHYNTRAGLESESRNLAYQMEQRKMTIISDRIASIEESISAHERAVKIIIAQDDDYQALMERSSQVMAHRDMLNATIAGLENNLKGHVARMNLLGGYFNFLASLKDGENLEKMKAASSPF